MNISLRISEVALKFPQKKSVVFAQDKSFYTFEVFEARANQMANFFQSIGISKGMRTLLFVTPRLDFSVLTFALFKLGAIPVLIDPGMGLKNLLHSIEQVKPEALVSIGKVHWLRRLWRRPFRNISIHVSLDHVGGKTHHLYDSLSSQPKTFATTVVTPDDPSAILFTSGGTGIPKGVLYTHGIMNAQTDALREMFQLDEDHTDLPGFPLFALFTLAMGMTSVIPEMDPTRPAQCDPKKLVRNILENQATFLAGSPAIWERVGEYCLENNIQLPSVKHLVMFGAPVRRQIHETFRKILPFGETFTPYGATECLPVTLVSGSQVLHSESERGRGTYVGKAVPGVTIKIVSISDIPETHLHEKKTGDKGEIVVSGTQVTRLYFDMPAETLKAKILDEQGTLWHRMGDLGYLDAEGGLWFLGRKAHRVETEQGVIFPLEAESPFYQLSDVKRVALVKLSHDDESAPGIVIERHDRSVHRDPLMMEKLQRIAKTRPQKISHFFFHPAFPVDVRHNIKVDQLRLGRWASKKVKSLR